MRVVSTAVTVLLLLTGPALGEEPASSVLILEPDQAVVQVNGIVCSFCAYGAEKSLSELDCLDRSQFGDGVLVDIHSHRITLAIAGKKQVPFGEVYERIKKAGYDPIRIHIRVAGIAVRKDGKLLLTSGRSGQVFALHGALAEAIADGEAVDIQAHLDAEGIPALVDGEAVELTLDRRLGAGS